MGEAAWERERIISGRPRAGRELTDAHTPLEAGLWDAVSLDKGCYIGQETLAKVSKLGALNRELWGLQLQAAAQPGTTVYAGAQCTLCILCSLHTCSNTFVQRALQNLPMLGCVVLLVTACCLVAVSH